MLEISSKSNLLEQKNYKYSLQDVPDPNLYRDIYDYESVPKVAFNHRRVPMNMPEEIWITDTSLRDGQQSVEPYSVDQIVKIYKLLNRLGGPYGIIRQTEFFIYSKRDREALEKCMALNLPFPEITSWIRANKEDFRLVRQLGIRETSRPWITTWAPSRTPLTPGSSPAATWRTSPAPISTASWYPSSMSSSSSLTTRASP